MCDRDRATTTRAGRLLLRLLLTAALVAGCGAGGAEDAPADRSAAPPAAPPAASEASSPARAATAAAPFDYTPKPAIPGFDRHVGSCDSYFRYAFQHPVAWEVEDSRNGAARMRTDDEIFNIEVVGDLGEIQAARMNEAAQSQGPEMVGEITVGGRRVDVHRPDPQSFAFQVPHPTGGAVMYHQFQAWSTFGAEETLRILDTLEPIEGCE